VKSTEILDEWKPAFDEFQKKLGYRFPVDVRKWVPGNWLYEGNVCVDDGLKPGIYRFRVGILDPRAGKPAIHLAIQGLQPDGWCDLGQIVVI